MGTVNFPNLGINGIELNRFINVFGFDIAWYAILITTGFLLATVYAIKNMKRFGLDPDAGLDVILFGLISAIVGARLYYVIFSWDSYKDDLLKIFNTREGGLAIYGGLIAALLVGALVCKIKKVKILPMFDVVSIGFLIGQAIGRWGNFVNIEAYGAQTSESFLFGMTSDTIANGPVHPCFLYESIWCAIGVFLLHFLSKKRKFDGEVFLMYGVWYGFERMIVEGLRTDSLYWGPFRVSQILSGAIFVASLIVIVVIRSRINRNNDENYLKLYVNTDASKDILALAAIREKDPKEYKKIMQEKKLSKSQKISSALQEDVVVEDDTNLDETVADSNEEVEIQDVLENDNLKKIDGLED